MRGKFVIRDSCAIDKMGTSLMPAFNRMFQSLQKLMSMNHFGWLNDNRVDRVVENCVYNRNRLHVIVSSISELHEFEAALNPLLGIISSFKGGKLKELPSFERLVEERKKWNEAQINDIRNQIGYHNDATIFEKGMDQADWGAGVVIAEWDECGRKDMIMTMSTISVLKSKDLNKYHAPMQSALNHLEDYCIDLFVETLKALGVKYKSVKVEETST